MVREPSAIGCVLVALASIVAAPAAATTITVDSTADDLDQGNNGNCTLREAVIAANANQGKDACPAGQASPVVDQIVVPAGVYRLAIAGPGQPGNEANQGDLDLTEDVDVRGAGQAVTIVDGDFIDRVFEIDTFSVTAQLFDLTVRHGRPAAPFEVGAGISSRFARLVLTDCTVTANDGVGIVHSGFRMELIRTTVSDNAGNGVVKTHDQVSLVDSVIRGNTAAGSGGGLRLSLGADATLVRTVVEGNHSVSDGGGIRVVGSTLALEDSLVRGNTANGSGGGIFATDSTVTIASSTIAGNRAFFSGGGLVLGPGSQTEMTNSTVSGNRADSRAGGVFFAEGSGFPDPELTATHVTFADNRSGAGAAALLVDSGAGTVTLTGSLLDGGCVVLGGTVSSAGGNLEGPGDGCSLDDPSDVSGLGAGDLALGPLGGYGGATPTHYLGPTSVALGAAPGATCPVEDQRGEPRPGPVSCDAGSFEVQPGEDFPLFEDGFETGDTGRWSTVAG